uniref:Terpene synthase n=1 Tax=Taiwania cryptomerioides TaxID=50187 RepID=A0A6C0THX3_TAICR|nr:terpene synthase 7 [Taiwania cryptomerioides]QIB02639.1 terpene synthase [Taiwania cryptomerioides]
MANLKGDVISSVSSMPDNAFNHWDDDFVQSIETPYGASEYHERAETLVKEVKILLKEMRSGDGDLIERLEMVDALQCLGIDRYFQDEIKAALDYVYRCWDGSVGLGVGRGSSTRNLNATALGLRVFRLHRYHVSADVLETFKDEDGKFFNSGGKDDNTKNSTIGEEHEMRSMLNLLRASIVAFPGETIMEEAKVFSSLYLKQILQNIGGSYNSSFLKEVEYALSFEWPRTFTIWEARNFIEIYELDNLRLKDAKILELAKLNFNMLQCVYKMEMKKLSSWWDNSQISKLIAFRERTVEYLLMGISVVDEIEFCSTRIAVAKVATLATILDDLFDDYLNLDQVELVTNAIIQGWDISLLQNFPNSFKETLEFVFKTVHELASEATKEQGRDMTQFITKAWADYAKANLQQARWNKSGYVPTYNEYIKIAATSAAIGPISLHSILLAIPVLKDIEIEMIFLNRSRLCDLIWSSLRLTDDAQDFQDEKLHGQTASAISSYMRDHPKCSEDDALCQINCLADQLIKELIWEYLNPNNIFLGYEKLCFNLSRGVQCFYIFGDGFTYPEKGVKHRVVKVLVDPV